MEGSVEITQEVSQKEEENLSVKKIFVAGATGSTGKRIVEQLLAKGFTVKAGVRDLDKARTTLSSNNPSLQIVSFFRSLGTMSQSNPTSYISNGVDFFLFSLIVIGCM